MEEYTFNADGSGTYGMVFDMSELSAMGGDTDSVGASRNVDTTLVFAKMLDDKKDSIAQLDPGEQEKLELLRPMRFAMKVNDSTGEMIMRLYYDFANVNDLSKFAEAIEAADLPELNELMANNPDASADSTETSKEPPLFDMAQAFKTEFNSSGFNRKITEEARERQVKEKDTTLKADDPFVDMIRYKQVFRFPYRVKEVNNERAKILSDFKGIELEANLYEINNNPDIFNLEVKFEKWTRK